MRQGQVIAKEDTWEATLEELKILGFYSRQSPEPEMRRWSEVNQDGTPKKRKSPSKTPPQAGQAL